jgi:hypothetical protein
MKFLAMDRHYWKKAFFLTCCSVFSGCDAHIRFGILSQFFSQHLFLFSYVGVNVMQVAPPEDLLLDS